MFHVMVYTCNDVNMGCLGGGGVHKKQTSQINAFLLTEQARIKGKQF